MTQTLLKISKSSTRIKPFRCTKRTHIVATVPPVARHQVIIGKLALKRANCFTKSDGFAEANLYKWRPNQAKNFLPSFRPSERRPYGYAERQIRPRCEFT